MLIMPVTLNTEAVEAMLLLAQYFKPSIDGSMLLDDDMAMLLNNGADLIYRMIDSAPALVTIIVKSKTSRVSLHKP